MTPRDRVLSALAHAQPDVTPCDYFATPEIHQDLMRHFGLAGEADTGRALTSPAGTIGENAVPERLGTDIQPDTPLENVLAVYRTVARRRGSSIL